MSDLLNRKVEDYSVKGKTISEIVAGMGAAGGFSGKDFSTGMSILKNMKNDKDCLKFLCFPACLIATGLRGVIVEMIKEGLVDVIFTTCGSLAHDLGKSWGGHHYHGSFELDDEKLAEKDIYRLGNILIPSSSYSELLENPMKEILSELSKQKTSWGPRELIHEFGLRVKDENSILHQAAKKNIPIFVPGITDGAFGTQLLWFSNDNDFTVDILKDQKELLDLTFKDRKTGALILGGGISKHHLIWWAQFSKGLDYAVAVTTASERDGSLSGARLKEAISWGKVSSDASKVTIDGDATTLLPFLMASVYSK
jgi:deoxyhypusine synthase